MKRFLYLSFLLTAVLTLSLTAPAMAQPEGHKIVTRTRLQVLFTDLESQWLAAVQGKDTATLDRLLGEEFGVWTPTLGYPTPREDWQPEAFARKLQSFRIEQMSVRAVSSSIAVANFRLTQTFAQGADSQSETYFVVDIWVNSGRGDNWKCTDRYLSRIADVLPPKDAKGDVKPTGKE